MFNERGAKANPVLGFSVVQLMQRWPGAALPGAGEEAGLFTLLYK